MRFPFSPQRWILVWIVLAAFGYGNTAQADLKDAAQKLLAATVTVEVESAATKSDTSASNPQEADVRYFNGLTTTRANPGILDGASVRRIAAVASGTVVGPEGLIVSAHLPEEADAAYRVVTPDGKRLAAKLLVSDRRSNLVLLKADAKNLPHLEIAEEPAQVGQQVVATVVDQGRGVRYVKTHRPRYVAVGIVAAAERRVEGISVSLLQTDLRSGAGSAGAPLADEDGRLIGILVASDLSDANQGITLAIPARFVSDLLESLRDENTVVIHPAYLGVQLQALEEEDGALVEKAFPDSPAAKAGVKEGDVITAVNGQAVANPADLTVLIGEQTPGAKTTLTVRRDGQEQQIEVVLGRREQAPAPQFQPQELTIELPQPARYRVVPLPSAEGVNLADAQALTQALAKLLAQQKQADVQESRPAEQKKADDANLAEQAYRRAFTRQLDQNALTPLTIYVQRTETDRRLDQLTEEVKSLREEVKRLTEQLEAISRNLKGDDLQSHRRKLEKGLKDLVRAKEEGESN